jgi:hypothetical protein
MTGGGQGVHASGHYFSVFHQRRLSMKTQALEAIRILQRFLATGFFQEWAHSVPKQENISTELRRGDERTVAANFG